MGVTCLGRGSLIRGPRERPVRRYRFDNGPPVPVELARQSRDGRVALAVGPSARPLRALGARMDPECLEDARRAPARREGTGRKRIGFRSPPPRSSASPERSGTKAIAERAGARGLAGTVRTALRPEFRGCGRAPRGDEGRERLRGPTGARRDSAERCLRRTPRPVGTECRRRIEAEVRSRPARSAVTGDGTIARGGRPREPLPSRPPGAPGPAGEPRSRPARWRPEERR